MTRAELVDVMAMDALNRRGFAYYIDPMEGGLDAYEISCEARDEATAALVAIEAAGWVCVPRGVTKEMADADPYGMGYGRIHAIWTRMLAASPLAQEPNDAR